jgi:hypothetical protein
VLTGGAEPRWVQERCPMVRRFTLPLMAATCGHPWSVEGKPR